jgi:predicted nucleic acid-binding protein
MQRIFVDTAAWIALEVTNDEHYKAATAFRRGPGRAFRWLTTNWVIWETVTWLRHRASHTAAVRFGERVLTSKQLNLILVTSEHEARAWELFKRYHDKEFSFVDCTSFVIMKALHLTTAFTFNGDFDQAGFLTLPEAK